MKSSDKKWKSINGYIRIGDMDNNYLINTIRLLERNAHKRKGNFEGHWEDYVDNIYWDMVREATHRGLEWRG